MQIGRDMAMRGGWYSDRNSVKSVVVFGCASIAIPILFALMTVVCKRGKSYILACLGILDLLAFVGIRALSFNPRVGRLNHLPLIGTHFNSLMELVGATLVCAGAILVTRKKP